jgi:phage-related tail fiber protein
MADEKKVIKFVSLENLGVYDGLIKEHIQKEDAKSLKTVVLDGNKLSFYRTEEPIAEGAEAAYEIELPQQDLSSFVHKITNATEGNVIITDTNGNIVDGGVLLSDLATKSYVDTKVSEEIGKAQHLQKEIVTKIPTVDTAKENVLYLIKDENAEGEDKYKEYLKVGEEVVCIGSTSTDLSTVYTKSEVDGKIKDASDAATASASTAETNAKGYTDEVVAGLDASVSQEAGDDGIAVSVTEVDGKLTAVSASIAANTYDKYGAASAVQQNLDQLSESLTACTEDEIKGLFSTEA